MTEKYESYLTLLEALEGDIKFVKIDSKISAVRNCDWKLFMILDFNYVPEWHPKGPLLS